MELEKDVRDANEAVDVLFNLPSLDSPLLEIDSEELISWRSTENKIKNRRDKYKISKQSLNYFLLINFFSIHFCPSVPTQLWSLKVLFINIILK